MNIDEAQRSSAELIALLDRVPDLVIIHRDGELLWMNRANLELLGYESVEDIAGRSLFEFVEPESRRLTESHMRAPVDPKTVGLSQIRLVARDGRVATVEFSPAQQVIFEREPARLVIAHDVTERVRLQEQLLVADRLASIGMLAAGVAHEVNNPLAWVLNNIEIAMRLLAPLGDAAAQSRQVLGVALEGVDRIRTIVRDLLALSRVDDVVVGPIDARAVVESTLALASKTIGERAELSLATHEVPLARGNAARLAQVLVNLITNALEAMPSGARDANRLRVGVHASNDGVVVEVIDNGVGIAPENAARIFEPFFTTKTPGSGTGLGLAISQRLVAEMGGWLSFESAPGNGSTFRVTLAQIR